MTKKKALIFGVNGQDGSYLSKFLLSIGYIVYGTYRNKNSLKNKNLEKLKIDKLVIKIKLNNFHKDNIDKILSNTLPDEVYLLGSPSSVSESFSKPEYYYKYIVECTKAIIESILQSKKNIKIFYPSSAECFGNQGDLKFDESSKFRPVSPYGLAKKEAHNLVDRFRQSGKLFICSGILFNHESSLRPKTFVTQKIIQSIRDVKTKKIDNFSLGNLDIIRDWGYAPEYVKAMWLMLQKDNPDNFIIATGIGKSLKDFLNIAFSHFNLSWQDHIVINQRLYRSNEVYQTIGNPKKANEELNWKSKKNLEDIIEIMINEKI